MITTSEYKWTGFISVTLASNKKTFCLFILGVVKKLNIRRATLIEFEKDCL